MSTDPAFAATPAYGVAVPVTAETNLSAPAQSILVLAAGASGTKIEEIVIEAMTTSLTPTTVAGLVYLFLYDGTTYSLFDVVTIRAIPASSTVAPYRSLPSDFASGSNKYANLWMKSGTSLRASQSIAGNASLLKVHAFGGDL